MKSSAKPRSGLTLTEMLCVLAILAILLALYVPAVIRAYVKVKHFLFGE